VNEPCSGTEAQITGETVLFWRRYCSDHRVPFCTQERGEQIIKDDPLYWNRNSMRKLWDIIDEELK
jgi:hypothetical protein